MTSALTLPAVLTQNERVHIDGMVARVDIVTVPQPGPVRLQATGKPDTLKGLYIR